MIRFALLAAALSLLAPQAAAQAPTRTILSNVNIVTLDERGVIEGGAVVIRNGQIERVLNPGQRAPRGEVIDGQGGYLIPGLIDAHMHYQADNELAGYLRYGVTTALSLGTRPEFVEALLSARQRQASGELVGAHLYATGSNFGGAPVTAAEVEPRLDGLQQNGFEFVKVYNEIPQDAFDTLVAGARRRGMGVFGHLPRQFPAEYSIGNGLDVIAHMEEFFFTAFEGPRDRDLDTFSSGWAPDYSRIDPILDRVAESDVAIIPNLVASFTFQSLWVDEQRTLRTPDLDFLEPDIAAAWFEYNQSRRDRIDRRQLREQIKFPLMRTLTYRAQQRGILLLAGSDAPIAGVFPGRSLHQELRLLVAAGLTNEEALRAAIINGGTAVRRWVDEGTCVGAIRAGCEADLVLLSANPLENIRNTESIVRIFADGRAYTPEELEALARPR
jgi:hypothetical protein